MVAHLTRSDCKGFLEVCASMQWMGLMMCCGMAVKGLGMLGVREMKALTVKMETVVLFGKGR